jgi:hypothetical protein
VRGWKLPHEDTAIARSYWHLVETSFDDHDGLAREARGGLAAERKSECVPMETTEE